MRLTILVSLFFLLPTKIFGFDIYPIKKRDEHFFSQVKLCQPTSHFKEDEIMPEKNEIYGTNNLRKKSGKAFFADGENIRISGRIMDGGCMPVKGAVIEIWHADANGLSDFEPEEKEQEEENKNHFHIKPKKLEKDKSFTGSGRYVTNNAGEYIFFTIKPSSKRIDKTPYVNIRVYHKDFGEIFTKMYFPCDERHCSNREHASFKRNQLDKTSSNFYAKKIINDIEEETFVFNIVFDKLDKKRFF